MRARCSNASLLPARPAAETVPEVSMTAPPAVLSCPIALRGDDHRGTAGDVTPVGRRRLAPRGRRAEPRVGETARVTNAVTAGRLAGTPTTPTPQQARSTWPRMAALGAALLVLGVLALTWSGVGPRVLVAAVALFVVVRGGSALRGARTGGVDRATAV